MKRSAIAVALLTTVALAGTLAGCSDASPRTLSRSGTSSAAAETPTTTQPRAGAPAPAVRAIGDVATGLDVPWGVDLLPGGSALVTERDSARVLRVGADGSVTPVGEVPDAVSPNPDSEGGLLGLAISPDFAADRQVYVYYSTAKQNRVARMSLRDGRLEGPRPVLDGIPSATFHNGGRLAFGPDGMLYIGTGDAKQPGLAQDRRSLAGKILRVTPQGRPAPGNPFGTVVYSYGHRNVQGLAFDPSGQLWAAEHGENTWDELNRIEQGGNYGWPRFEGRPTGGDQGTIAPIAQWRTADASPSGIAITGDSVYMAALRGERLWRIPLNGAATPRPYLADRYGRLRTVAATGNGELWVTTSNRDGRGQPRPGDDRILRITTR